MEEESFVEMDSFTADMLKKIEKHKKLFSNISTDDDNLEEMRDETTNEQIENNNKIDGDDNELRDEEEEDDDEDDELLNDDYCVNKVRESVSYLLNVRKSLLPSEIPGKTVEEEEEEEEEVVEKEKVEDSVPNSRLNRRLNKISMFYEDELTDNNNKKNKSKNTVLSEVNSNVEEERPARRLKLQDRLKEIASSYYPVWQDNDELSDIKKKSNINKAEELKLNTKSESAIVDSSSSTTTTTSDKSVSKQTENLFKSKSVAYEKTATTSTISNNTTKSKSIWNNKPLEDSKVSSSKTVVEPAVPLTKKTSVADLTKLFESKSKEESGSIVPERPPELLTLREKRRLFEKAIKDESEASSKQYRRQPGPLKRPIQMVVSSTNSKEDTESSIQPDSKRPNIEKQESELVEEPLENPPEIQQQQEEDVDEDIDDEHENSDRDISKADDIGEQTAQDSVGEAFKTIDNYSIDEEEEEDLEDEDTTGIQMEESKIIPTPAIDMDITFSTLDNPKIMIRSSTRTNVLGQQEMPLNEIDEEQLEEDPEAPEKPPRLIRYSTLEQILDENDSQGELEQEPEQVPVDEAPLRTISFYRREQKMRKEGGCGDLNQAFDADSVDQVVYLKQNQLAEKPESFGETDLVQFKIDLHEKIQTLKAEINEHNRISQQASTALNMCMSVPDLVNSSGRIEAERLLLISAEKRTACLAEINRLKSMIQNPEKFLPTLTGPPGSKGTVVINNLRIPLRNDFVVSRAKGKVSSSFYFLCLICNGPKIFISELLNTEKNLGNEYLEFNFGLNVTELEEDFHVELKLFSFELNPNHSESSHNHKNKSQHNRLFKRSFKESLKLSSSISSPAKVLSSKKHTPHSKSSGSSAQERSTDSPIPKSMTSSMLTNFKEIGRVTLTLANVRQTPKYYLLESFSITNPLDGYLTMNVSLKVSHHYTAQGFFDIQDSATSFWNLRWFVIRGHQLLYWRFPTDAQNGAKPALGSINLKNCINPSVGFLRADQRHLCMRPNTFVLVMIQPPVVSNATKLIKGGTITKPVPEIHFISSQSKEDSTLFCHHINRAIRNIRTWEIDAVRPYSNEEFDRLILNSH